MEISLFEAVILGLVQGITEFLPISSSGHLVIMQHFLGFTEPALTFDVLLHLGTLVSVFIVFWEDIWAIIKNPFQKMSLLVLAGAIPTAMMGFLLDDFFTALFGSVKIVGFMLLITGLLLWVSDRFHGKKTVKEMSYVDAVIIGIFQGIAITPGISRSGSTIVGALWRGLDRTAAARYSFLLSIPVILGAGLKEIVEVYQVHDTAGFQLNFLVGMVVSAVSGYYSIKFLLKLLQGTKLRVFSYYCWIVGFLIVIFSHLSVV